MTVAAQAAALREDFAFLDEWEARFTHLIDLGKSLPPLKPEEYAEANKVRGCSSQVWVVSERADDGRLVFRAESDAQIPQGLIAVLLKLYSSRLPAEIMALDPQVAVDRLKLGSMLTSQRANGLASMIERIRREATGA